MDKAIEKAINMLNSVAADTLKDDGIFVANIEINGLEYYYDKDNERVKLLTHISQQTNDKLFSNDRIKQSFADFLQVVADEVSASFTADEDMVDMFYKAVAYCMEDE